MKGKPEVQKVLAEMLKEELGAISQYFVHSEMCENWGYERLSELIKKQAIGEMKHAEVLIERILFLEGMPNMADLPKLNIGKDVKQQLQNDLDLELSAVPLTTRPLPLAAKQATVARKSYSKCSSRMRKSMLTSWRRSSASSRTSVSRIICSIRPENSRQFTVDRCVHRTSFPPLTAVPRGSDKCFH